MSLKEAIKTATKGLDHAVDADWQEDGRPSLKRVHQLAKTTEISQEQLDDAVPDLKRNRSINSAASHPTPEASKTKAIVNPPAAAIKGKVSKEDAEVEAIRKASNPAEVAERVVQPFVENTLVVAKEVGFYGQKLRDPGEKFYYTGRLGKWMEVADKKDAKALAEERAEDA